MESLSHKKAILHTLSLSLPALLLLLLICLLLLFHYQVTLNRTISYAVSIRFKQEAAQIVSLTRRPTRRQRPHSLPLAAILRDPSGFCAILMGGRLTLNDPIRNSVDNLISFLISF